MEDSSEHAMGAQQCKQTSTSVKRRQVSGERAPLAESHLLLCFISFHVFCKFPGLQNKYTKLVVLSKFVSKCTVLANA